MIDTHCHVDLYKDPISVARSAEENDVTTVAVTYLPSHYELARTHLCHFRKVRPALGLHPLAANSHRAELQAFRELASQAVLIGEIGLDFSNAGRATRVQQEESFAFALDSLKGIQRFITLHSRGAEDEVLMNLRRAQIDKAVFHWFSGSRAQLLRIVDAGHLLSINPAMIRTAKWQDFIKLVPKEVVLTESDGPFARLGGRIAAPTDMAEVVSWLASAWKISGAEAESQVSQSFSAFPF